MVRQVCLYPADRPVLGITFLIVEDQDDVGSCFGRSLNRGRDDSLAISRLKAGGGQCPAQHKLAGTGQELTAADLTHGEIPGLEGSTRLSENSGIAC